MPNMIIISSSFNSFWLFFLWWTCNFLSSLHFRWLLRLWFYALIIILNFCLWLNLRLTLFSNLLIIFITLFLFYIYIFFIRLLNRIRFITFLWRWFLSWLWGFRFFWFFTSFSIIWIFRIWIFRNLFNLWFSFNILCCCSLCINFICNFRYIILNFLRYKFDSF